MRAAHLLFSALVVLAVGDLRAQCSLAVQKLIGDQKYDDARSEAQALIKKNAADDAALHCMGRIYAAEGKSGDAVDWLEKAVKVNDKNALHHVQLGNALGTEAQKASKLRQPFLARRIKTEFELAVACDPKLADAHEGLMEFYLQAPAFMGGSLEKAKEQAQIISAINAYEGHVAAASIARREKDAAGEQQALEAALAAAPDTANAWYQLDLFYQNHEKWPEALRASRASAQGAATVRAGRTFLLRPGVSRLGPEPRARGARDETVAHDRGAEHTLSFDVGGTLEARNDLRKAGQEGQRARRVSTGGEPQPEVRREEDARGAEALADSPVAGRRSPVAGRRSVTSFLARPPSRSLCSGGRRRGASSPESRAPRRRLGLRRSPR